MLTSMDSLNYITNLFIISWVVVVHLCIVYVFNNTKYYTSLLGRCQTCHCIKYCTAIVNYETFIKLPFQWLLPAVNSFSFPAFIISYYYRHKSTINKINYTSFTFQLHLSTIIKSCDNNGLIINYT